MSHTPGPWTAFYKHKYDEWHVSLPASDSGMRLALCDDGITSENREADARLIAAAPDLLAMLKVAQLWLDIDGRYDMQGINAAIAKAEGKS